MSSTVEREGSAENGEGARLKLDGQVLKVKTVQMPLSYIQTLASLMHYTERKTRQELSYTPQSHV